MNKLDRAHRNSPNNLSLDGQQLPTAEQLHLMLQEVIDSISPVWPLKDYVAVNPYFGLSQRRFMDARAYLKVFSDCELLMPVSYYAEQYQHKRFDSEDIALAILETAEVGLCTCLDVAEISARLDAEIAQRSTLDQPAPESNPHRRIRSIAEMVTQSVGVDWTEAVRDEISKFCACHYDTGQASWQSPWRHLPLFQAWRTLAACDRNMDSLGASGFCDYVQQLPHTAPAAIVFSLNRLGIPQALWSTFLLCQAYSIPGWSAWTKYQDMQMGQLEGQDFVGLLAMRLAYDVVLGETFAIRGTWDQFVRDEAACFPMPMSDNDSVLRIVLLRASEIGFRKTLLQSLTTPTATDKPVARKPAQMIFCIDVRSERIRRQIEMVTDDVETFGFAGFFGMPMAFTSVSEPDAVAQLPVLLQPQFQVHQRVRGGSCADSKEIDELNRKVQAARVDTRSWRKLWREFQTSAVGCFSFVETTGMVFGYKLMCRAFGWQTPASWHYDGVDQEQHPELGPTLRGLESQGLTLERQVALAAGMLTNLGLLNNFSPLVVFCGHASQTDNNPLAAGLDCGACGGHSGEPNARFAALLLNRPEIRAALVKRGITIPADTHFLGAVHNTTTDQIEFCDLKQLPTTHRAGFQKLHDSVTTASQQTREERLPIVASRTLSDLMRRAVDWSEVRPEWGLAGNAAFIVAPRAVTRQVNLNARAFLHSYDHTLDPDRKVLELIMTAPMIVANWINMQYYASTVDNHHFGSGNKTVHNVVGQFGVLSGNGGDLQTGLPWQSLHTGEHYQHLPLRLQVVIVAPRVAIEQVIDKHEVVRNLITHGWLHLLAIEPDNGRYRYTAEGTWAAI